MMTILEDYKDRPVKRGNDAQSMNLAKRMKGVNLGNGMMNGLG